MTDLPTPLFYLSEFPFKAPLIDRGISRLPIYLLPFCTSTQLLTVFWSQDKIYSLGKVSALIPVFYDNWKAKEFGFKFTAEWDCPSGGQWVFSVAFPLENWADTTQNIKIQTKKN